MFMFSTKKVCGSLLSAALLLTTTTAGADELGRRYLALDPSLHGSFTNAQVVLGQTTNTQMIDPAFESWEINNNFNHGPAFSVMTDHNGMYRMYYGVRGDSSVGTAVQVSSDGINWTRITTNHQFTGSNLINLAPGGDANSNGYLSRVFFDSSPDTPTSERYKLIWTTGSSTYGAISSDGINFSQSFKLFDHRNEHMVSGFYDTMREEYVMYGRIRGASSWTLHNGSPGFDDERRGAAMHSTSGNFLDTWDNVGNTALDPEQYWDYPNQTIRPDFYNPGMIQYHGQYIGFPNTYYRDEDRVAYLRPDRWTGTGPQYPTIVHSLNGVDFTLADDSLVNAHSILDLTPHLRVDQHPEWPYNDPSLSNDPAFAPWTVDPNLQEVGQIQMTPDIVELHDKILMYHFVRDDTHYLADGYPNLADTFRNYVSELRIDGFASVKADEGEEGQWLTNADIEVPEAARGLLVNADVKEDGSLRVEVLDTEGQVIGNLSLENSIAFQGDETSQLMQWSAGQFNDAAGQTVQLRFVVEDGEIYSFSFSAIPEPASLTLLGLGGAMLLRRKR